VCMQYYVYLWEDKQTHTSNMQGKPKKQSYEAIYACCCT
jgi:hypothetical protein